MYTFIKEFKIFIKRGNVIDLAVAVIIGGAFGKIVTSLVRDILTPIISLLLGEQGFENYKYVIRSANEAEGIAENAIYYGLFLQNIIDFLIIALTIYTIVYIINKARYRAQLKEQAEKEVVKKNSPEEPKQPKTEDLLTDIKNMLQEKFKK